MKAISLHQPWASLCVTRQPCDCEYDQVTIEVDGHGASCPSLSMVKRFETRGWPCPPALYGSRIAIHATKRKPYDDEVGDLRTLYRLLGGADLPLGAVVGSATIEACYPIVRPALRATAEHVGVWEDRDGCGAILYKFDRPGGDLVASDVISDQLPYGDFTPGRYAWSLVDAAPTTERCPWCWGSGVRPPYIGPDAPNCPVCRTDVFTNFAAGRCDPIPARGRQRIWNWNP